MHNTRRSRFSIHVHVTMVRQWIEIDARNPVRTCCCYGRRPIIAITRFIIYEIDLVSHTKTCSKKKCLLATSTAPVVKFVCNTWIGSFCRMQNASLFQWWKTGQKWDIVR